MTRVHGIHHITAIGGAPQENLDFYVGVLGLRLVKKSINQDAPDTYHFFFADAEGHPGTDLTFFPWPDMGPGRLGAGVWGEVGFVVPPGSLTWWEEHLRRAGITVGEREVRFGEPVLPFVDPHGMGLSLTETHTYPSFAFTPWEQSSVPAEHQIRALGSVALTVHDESATVDFLGGSFGFTFAGEDTGRRRYVVGDGAGGQRVDITVDPKIHSGAWGVGSVHHVAFRVPDGTAQQTVEEQVLAHRGRSSGVIDRFWFASIYVREPSGALCEVATDGPGFGVDEDMAHLGETLVLPPWYEEHRAKIEAHLTPITLPTPTPAEASR
ncbi:MAG: ring-cleaving dioxygenase [Spirochaeta sp.]|nr:ring-cleaving dioxygenase [Spirochaeta sp.]